MNSKDHRAGIVENTYIEVAELHRLVSMLVVDNQSRDVLSQYKHDMKPKTLDD